MTFHVSENGETVLQEAYEAATSETGELTQIAIEAYEGGGDFSVIDQAVEEIHSPGYRLNICYYTEKYSQMTFRMRLNVD